MSENVSRSYRKLSKQLTWWCGQNCKSLIPLINQFHEATNEEECWESLKHVIHAMRFPQFDNLYDVRKPSMEELIQNEIASK